MSEDKTRIDDLEKAIAWLGNSVDNYADALDLKEATEEHLKDMYQASKHAQKVLMQAERCPSCMECFADDRQESRPNLCRWCGYDYDKNKPAGFVSASDPFAHL